MDVKKIIWQKLLSTIVIVGLLFPMGGWNAMPTSQSAAAAPAQLEATGPAVDTGAWFRTRVTFPDTTSRARLDVLGVVVLDEGPDWALVLADADQLESLARLRFEPRASDDLDMLVEAHAHAVPRLAASLQPLLARAVAPPSLTSPSTLGGTEGGRT